MSGTAARRLRMICSRAPYQDESGITDVVKESLLQDIGNITAMERLLDVSVLDRAVDAIDRCSTVYGVAMFASEVSHSHAGALSLASE